MSPEPPVMQHRDVDEHLNDLARVVIGAAIEVHRELGPGLGEAIYENALMVELANRGIAFERQVKVPVNYKGVLVGESIVDLFVSKCLIVELKAVSDLLPLHDSQVITYMKLLRAELGCC